MNSFLRLLRVGANIPVPKKPADTAVSCERKAFLDGLARNQRSYSYGSSTYEWLHAGKKVATAYVIDSTEREYVLLSHVFVEEEYRRRGIATRILQELILKYAPKELKLLAPLYLRAEEGKPSQMSHLQLCDWLSSMGYKKSLSNCLYERAETLSKTAVRVSAVDDYGQEAPGP